jgi:hypothetical protein
MIKIIGRYFTRHLHVIWLNIGSILEYGIVNIAVKLIIIEFGILNLENPN